MPPGAATVSLAAWGGVNPPGAAWGRLGPPGATWGRLGSKLLCSFTFFVKKMVKLMVKLIFYRRAIKIIQW